MEIEFPVKDIFKGWDKFDFIIAGAMIFMSAPVFVSLYVLGWKSAGYDHGVFILPISLWLIWRKRAVLLKRQDLSKTGAALFLIGVLIYLYAGLNDFMFLRGIAFVVMMWAVFKLRFTNETFKNILFPLAYLIFLIPPPGIAIDSATFPLKTISTLGSYSLLKLFHLPVQVAGVILKVGTHELFIADACSGFRSITTLLALGAVYAYFQSTSKKQKWIIFLSVIPLGILGNMLRLTLTGMISYFIGAKYAEGFFHEVSGGVLFVFTVVGLIGVTELIVKKHAK